MISHINVDYNPQTKEATWSLPDNVVVEEEDDDDVDNNDIDENERTHHETDRDRDDNNGPLDLSFVNGFFQEHVAPAVQHVVHHIEHHFLNNNNDDGCDDRESQSSETGITTESSSQDTSGNTQQHESREISEESAPGTPSSLSAFLAGNRKWILLIVALLCILLKMTGFFSILQYQRRVLIVEPPPPPILETKSAPNNKKDRKSKKRKKSSNRKPPVSADIGNSQDEEQQKNSQSQAQLKEGTSYKPNDILVRVVSSMKQSIGDDTTVEQLISNIAGNGTGLAASSANADSVVSSTRGVDINAAGLQRGEEILRRVESAMTEQRIGLPSSRINDDMHDNQKLLSTPRRRKGLVWRLQNSIQNTFEQLGDDIHQNSEDYVY